MQCATQRKMMVVLQSITKLNVIYMLLTLKLRKSAFFF
jgi:hypothetical protein